jgi:hypothetical protein
MMEIFSLTLLAILVAISLVAFFAVLYLFFPQRIDKTRLVLESAPGRSFLVGLVNFGFFAALALAFFALGNWAGVELLGLVGLLLLIVPGVGAIFGLAGVVEFVSDRLAPGVSGVRRTAWGTLTLALACALPFVGWFGLLPYVSLLGLGALITGLVRRERGAESAAERDSTLD